MATFRPPVAFNGARVLPTTTGPARDLWKHYGSRPVGQSVLKLDGAYQTIQTPTQLQCAAATELYQGGHDYQIDSATAAALTAAGYGAYIE